MRRVCVSMLNVTGRTSIQASRHIGINSVRLLSLLPPYDDAWLSSLPPVTNISMCNHAERVIIIVVLLLSLLSLAPPG